MYECFPPDATNILVSSVSKTSSLVSYSHNGKYHSKLIPKRNLSTEFKTPATIRAFEGELTNVVLDRLSDKFNLSLILGKDYDFKNNTIKFEGLDKIYLVVVISDGGIFNTGKLEIIVYNRGSVNLLNLPNKDFTGLNLNLNIIKLRLLLNSKIFEKKDVFIPGDESKLSESMVVRLTEFITLVGGMPSHLHTAKILCQTKDNISNVLVSNLNGNLFTLRYK